MCTQFKCTWPHRPKPCDPSPFVSRQPRLPLLLYLSPRIGVDQVADLRVLVSSKPKYASFSDSEADRFVLRSWGFAYGLKVCFFQPSLKQTFFFLEQMALLVTINPDGCMLVSK